MSPEFESRRQRREAEAQAPLAGAGATSASAPAPTPAPAAQVALPAVAAPLPSRRELRQQQQNNAGMPQGVFSYPALPLTQDFAANIADAFVASPLPSPAPVQAAPTYSPTFTPTFTPASAPASAQTAAQAPAPAPTQTAAQAPAPAPSRRDLREQLRQQAEPVAAPVTPFAQPWSEPPITPMFETSSGFSIDTTTNSVVLPITPDALSGPLLIDTGVTLRTGSIDLTSLNVGTGSIALPTAAQIADDALSLDSANSFVSNIAPVAARNLIKKNPKLGLAPVKTKGSQGQLFYGLTTSFLMLTVGALLVAAWMYGVIK
jgi:hypothetical protein